MAKTWMKPANLKAPLKVIVLDFGEKKGTVTVACGRFPTYSCGSHSQGATMARSELKTSPKSVDYWIASRTRYIVGFNWRLFREGTCSLLASESGFRLTIEDVKRVKQLFIRLGLSLTSTVINCHHVAACPENTRLTRLQFTFTYVSIDSAINVMLDNQI